MTGHPALGALLAALIAGWASLACAASCPPGQRCDQASQPEKPAPPRREPQSVRPMAAPAPPPRSQIYQAPSPARPDVRATPRANQASPGPLLIQRNAAGGYSRHTVGAPPRPGHGYVYNGRRHPPVAAGGYRWPAGYRYHRFHVHERFPRIFLIPEFFIADYDAYDLAPPPPNAQWVRYGDDLVLVDLDTGEILDEITGFFADDGGGDEGPPPDDAPQPDGAPSPY